MSKLLTPQEVADLLYSRALQKARQRGERGGWLDYPNCFSLDHADISDRVATGVCEQTGLAFDWEEGRNNPWRASLDRINNRRGYHPDNVQITLKIYNTAKWTWTDADVLGMARALVAVHGMGD